MRDRFGEMLTRARLGAGLTLRELEHRVGLSNAYLSQLENHTTHPSLETAVLLCEHLQLKLEDFAELYMDCRGRWG